MSKTRKYYDIDEFNGVGVECADTLENIIAKKVHLLHDFCILEDDDDREDIVKDVLGRCTNGMQMDILLHDILVGKTTLDAMLQSKGVM